MIKYEVWNVSEKGKLVLSLIPTSIYFNVQTLEWYFEFIGILWYLLILCKIPQNYRANTFFHIAQPYICTSLTERALELNSCAGSLCPNSGGKLKKGGKEGGRGQDDCQAPESFGLRRNHMGTSWHGCTRHGSAEHLAEGCLQVRLRTLGIEPRSIVMLVMLVVMFFGSLFSNSLWNDVIMGRCCVWNRHSVSHARRGKTTFSLAQVTVYLRWFGIFTGLQLSLESSQYSRVSPPKRPMMHSDIQALYFYFSQTPKPSIRLEELRTSHGREDLPAAEEPAEHSQHRLHPDDVRARRRAELRGRLLQHR